MVFVATMVLAATLSMVRFLDISAAPQEPAPEAAGLVSQPLAIPGGETTAPIATEMPALVQDEGQAPSPERGAEAPELLAFVVQPGLPAREPTAAAADVPVARATEAPDQAQPLAGQDEAPPAAALVEQEPQPSEPASAIQRIDHVVAAGDSLASIFARNGWEPALLHRIVNSGDAAKRLAQLRPGQQLRFALDETGELNRVDLQRSRVETLRVTIADDMVYIETISKAVEKRVAATAGIIESSLFLDGQKAGLSDGQIMELAAIFGWDIDFALEIRAGDEFRVLYEEDYLDGEKLRDGPILAAEFVNRGTVYRAVRYEDQNGEIGYFDADGNSKRRAFIRTPIKFARVSSRFTLKRWHPVLKKWRSHKGVDYAAPTGTPVKATGDGRVAFRGTKSGYGKTVILEHAGQYTTLYAHLSGYSKRARPGTRVKQGQVIGYVGQTGLATGPHLHYEFRVSGVHRDPLRVKLPKSLALAKTELPSFHRATAPLLAQLEAIPSETMVASVGTSQTP